MSRSTGRSSGPLSGRPSPGWAHLLDLVFFRVVGAGILAHEVLTTHNQRWMVLVAGFCAFFMPDWLRGPNSIPALVARRLAERMADRIDPDGAP